MYMRKKETQGYENEMKQKENSHLLLHQDHTHTHTHNTGLIFNCTLSCQQGPMRYTYF